MKHIAGTSSSAKRTPDELCLNASSQVKFSLKTIGQMVQTILRNYLTTMYGTRFPEEFWGCGFLASLTAELEHGRSFLTLVDVIVEG